MITYELADMDLADVRFAVSPLNELALSLRVWRDPGRYPLHLPWLRRLQAERPGMDGELLVALTDGRLWTPDFLTPAPVSPLTRIEDELAALRRVDPRVVAADLSAVHPGAELPAPLQGPPDQVLRRIVAALEVYWQLCFTEPWPRMRALLEADVVHRAREIAQHGLGHMFAGLADTVTFADGEVRVRMRTRVSYRRSTRGQGLTLVPTLFTMGASAPISAEQPPLLMYGARGVGTLWETAAEPPPGALAGLIGPTRARLLDRLGTPASTTELAVRAGVTPAGVNQHLQALRAAGLLTATRYGRSVLYCRSELGDLLVGRGGS